jgi:hypothetical protein
VSSEFGWQLHVEILIALAELHFGENFHFSFVDGAGMRSVRCDVRLCISCLSQTRESSVDCKGQSVNDLSKFLQQHAPEN